MICRPCPKLPPSKREMQNVLLHLSSATGAESAVAFLRAEIVRIWDEDPTDSRIAGYGRVLAALELVSAKDNGAHWLRLCLGCGKVVPTTISNAKTA